MWIYSRRDFVLVRTILVNTLIHVYIPAERGEWTGHSLCPPYMVYMHICVCIYRKGKVCVWEELSLCRCTCTYVCVYINIYMAGKLVCKELSSLSKHSSKYMNGVRELHSFVNIWHVLALYMYMSVQTVLSLYI